MRMRTEATVTDQQWDDVEASAPSRQPASARGRRTRARLLESGREAMAERGLVHTRVDDVVGRAGTSHGTFYLYFENIDDLLLGLIEECDEQAAVLLSQLGGTAAGDTASVAATLEGFGQLRSRYGEVASPWLQPEGVTPPRLATLSQHLPMEADRAVAVLALIDRVLPELAHNAEEASTRVAALVDSVRTPVGAASG